MSSCYWAKMNTKPILLGVNYARYWKNTNQTAKSTAKRSHSGLRGIHCLLQESCLRKLLPKKESLRFSAQIHITTAMQPSPSTDGYETQKLKEYRKASMSHTSWLTPALITLKVRNQRIGRGYCSE